MKTLNLKRRHFLAGSAATIGLGMVGLPTAWAEGKTLKIRNYADIQNLDPAFNTAQADAVITDSLLLGLVRMKTGTEWGWEKEAAEEIEQVDPTHVRFKLKSGLKWSNGYGTLTAEDVKYSFERVANPKVQSPYIDDWATLDHVEVHDELSGTIVLKEPFAPLWTTTLPGWAGKIVSKAAMEKLPDQKFTTTMPAVSGPYMIKEWVPKQRLTLVRNPDYTGGETAYYDQIEVYPIEDEKAAEIAFESRDLDFTDISLSSLKTYKDKGMQDATITEHPALSYVWFGQNQENPALKDPKIREAIQKAIDVNTVLDAAYFGAATRATGIIAPGLVGHREANLTNFDPDAAREELKAAGAEGLKLKLSFLNKAEWVAAAQVIQANLADVGVDVTLEPLDSGTFWTIGDEKSGNSWKDLQLLLGRFSMNPDPAWATAWFTCKQVGVWDWERFCSKEYDQLHESGLRELDPAKRGEMYVKMQDIMEKSGSYLFLTHEATAAIYRNSVAPALKPDGTAVLWRFGAAA
ncbi:ABC transporter substrate-binding protein [Dongia soli]|uniref:ABC transporter substrate-binding protein n=1 Tax=Dongia soli TaxID=600628 RepID=A0ABU5E7J1_9PROT|nr:ABC transporter substrate-binding protein [Dongia soli]MDY0881600.1 ABC transporter substrate-binding protein [Dongia soli]